MKKRIISMLLTVLMVMSLFSGLPLSAYAATTAGANTIEYTMAAGDYVLRICQKFGLNYYTCKDAIMILNNIYDGQWNKLAVGRTLILPASDNDAILIANGAKLTNINSGANATTLSTGTAATYTTGTATTGTSVATTTTFKSADGLAYYLVPYTMSAGENVSGVCNSLGVNFNIFSPFIKQVNGISDWTKVRAGQTLIIPTPVCPSVGTTCYGVMQHKVSGSDTAYGIVTSNGVNYNANKTLLEVLNQTNNLASLTAGQWFYYPVPLTVSVPGTGNPGGTATTTTTTTTTDGNGTTTTTSTTTSKLYKLTSGMSASDGTMLFYVNSQAVTAAPAGAKVTIVTDTKSGKAIQSLTVKQSDGKADFLLTNDSFIMPGCDVRVDASVKNGLDINIEANYSGKATATVGGVTVMSAVKGATVVVKSNDPNYEISSLYVYYKKMVSSANKTEVKHSSSNAFIMPDASVTVEVTLKPVATYAFYVNDPAHGSYYLKVNGSPVTRAAKGAQVTLVATPESGYVPGYITVSKHGDPTKFVNFFNNSFTMPGYDVDVHVSFVANGDNILIMPAAGGDAEAYEADGISVNVLDVLTGALTVGADPITERGSGEWVALKANPETTPMAYQLDPDNPYDVVRNSDGLKVKVYETTDGSGDTYHVFKMPKGGVTVTPHFVGMTLADIFAVIKLNGTNATAYSDCSFSVTVDGKKGEFMKTGDRASDAKVLGRYLKNGESVDLRDETSEGIAFVKYAITVGAVDGTGNFVASTVPADQLLSEELTNAANNHGYFEMPNRHIQITADFEKGTIAIGQAVVTGVGSVGYEVTGMTGGPASAATCKPGDVVTIYPVPGNGFRFDDSKYDAASKSHTKLFVNRKDNGAALPLTQVASTMPGVPFAYQFTMPAEGVDVKAIFDPKPFVITMKCVDEAGNPITGKGIWQIAINWVIGALDLNPAGTKVEVAYEDYVTVAMTDAGWSKYDMVSFRIDGMEYTADELNYFYNFQMIDERAKDLEIVAVLRPRTPYGISIHNLTAMYDVTKGGVEFLILNSETHYSDDFRINSSGRLNYVKKAVAGDTVAIVPKSVDSKYEVKASDISITPWYSDADRIVPTEAWYDPITDAVSATYVAGYTKIFVFTMPDSDLTITVNFAGTKQALYISVLQKKIDTLTLAETYEPVSGMVRLFANDLYRDVASDATFNDIPYKTQVQILRSELALAEGKKIAKVDMTTASGSPVSYTDMSNAGEGILFTMPDEPVWVIIKIEDIHYDLPTFVIDTDVKNGKLVFRKTPDPTDPVADISDFKVGDTVYVFAQPDEGYKNLDAGDLKVYVNGMNNGANIDPLGTVLNVITGEMEPVWKFTLPGGTIIFKAEFQKENAKTIPITLAFIDENGNPTTNAKYKAKVSVAGLEKTFSAADAVLTFNMTEGQTLSFVSDSDGYSIARIQAASGRGVDGTTYTVPSLDDIAPATADTVTIYMKSESNSIKWQATGGSLLFTVSGNNVVAANEGDTVTITATPDAGYLDLEAVNLIVAKADASEVVPVTLTSAPGVTPTTWDFVMPAGGVLVKATFEPNNQVNVTLNMTKDTTLTIDGLGSTTLSGSITYPLTIGTVIKIEPAADGCNQVEVNSTVYGSHTGTYVNYTVPSTSDTVMINPISTAKAVQVEKMTNGTVYLRKTNSSTALPENANNFVSTDSVYIQVVPNTGYAEKPGTFKAIDINNLDQQTTSTAPSDYQVLTIPDGGIKISCEFEPVSVTINYTVTGAHAATDIIAQANSVGILGSGGGTTVKYNDEIKIVLANGYSWGASPITVTGSSGSITASVVGNTATFKVTDVGPINVALNVT